MEKGLNLFDPRTGRFERFEPRGTRQPSHDAVHSLFGVRRALGRHPQRPSQLPGRKAFKTYTTDGLAATWYASERPQGPVWLSTTNGLC
jgi:hypothetical protein